MTQLTIEISDELAKKLQSMRDYLPEIIEMGLFQVDPASTPLYTEVAEFLASGPTSEEILALRPSETTQERIRELLDKNRAGSLTETEEVELDQALKLNHLMSLVKIYARRRLSQSL